MTPEQKAAYVIAQSVAAFAEVAGMIAINSELNRQGHALAYNDMSFYAVIERYGLHSNALITFFRE
jgi:hypothetical protein